MGAEIHDTRRLHQALVPLLDMHRVVRTVVQVETDLVAHKQPDMGIFGCLTGETTEANCQHAAICGTQPYQL